MIVFVELYPMQSAAAFKNTFVLRFMAIDVGATVKYTNVFNWNVVKCRKLQSSRSDQKNKGRVDV